LTRIESVAFQNSSIQSIFIPRNVEILGSRCFSSCKSLSSIPFESNSYLTRIESYAVYESSLQSIVIPSNVEILGSKCFSDCESLSSISFESNSHLTRIELETFSETSLIKSEKFSDLSLQSTVIPPNVQFTDDSAFLGVALSSISIESESEIFVIESNFHIHHLNQF
jgi:hypothetical protein